MEKKNYQFTQVPTNLFILLDNNCRSMLFTLIQLSSYYADEDGWFFRTCSDLEAESDLSQNLVKATLQTLFNHNLIEARPTGQGKGRKPNYYKVNFERFEEYDKIPIEDAMKNPDLKIRTVPYKGSCFKLNLVRDTVVETVTNTVKNTVTNTVKSDHNIYNIDNVYNLKNIDNVYNKEIENDNILEEKKHFNIECKNENIEINREEPYEDKNLEKELEKAIEQNLIPTVNKKVELKKQFVQHCDVSIKRKAIPDEEDLASYLKRTRAYA